MPPKTPASPLYNTPGSASKATNKSASLLNSSADLGPLAASEFKPEIDEDFLVDNGLRVVYDRSVQLQLCSEDANAKPKAWEAISVRILVSGADSNLDTVVVELTSEQDLFFHYTHSLTAAEYVAYAESQKLRAAFHEYPTVLIRMCNDCLREPNTFLAVLVQDAAARSARLDFIQNYEYKLVELLSCHFVTTDEKRRNAHVEHRYRAARAQSALLAQRLDAINHLIKIKSPSLLLQLQQQQLHQQQTKSPKKRIGF